MSMPLTGAQNFVVFSTLPTPLVMKEWRLHFSWFELWLKIEVKVKYDRVYYFSRRSRPGLPHRVTGEE